MDVGPRPTAYSTPPLRAPVAALGEGRFEVLPEPRTLNPEPWTLNPEPWTLKLELNT